MYDIDDLNKLIIKNVFQAINDLGTSKQMHMI